LTFQFSWYRAAAGCCRGPRPAGQLRP